MKARLATLLLSSVAAALAAQSAGAATTYEEADVVESRPIYRIVEVSSPQEECWEEEVVRQDVRRRGDSYTPGLLGMVIGGALGNAVGHNSSNRKVGTVVGAVLGGSIARDIQRSNDARNSTVYVDTEERCRTVYNTREEEKLVGYDVSYVYNGVERTVRMPEDPGATVRVRVDVEPVL